MSSGTNAGRALCYGLLSLVLSFYLWFEFQHPLTILLFIFSFCAIGYFVVEFQLGITKGQKLESLIVKPEKLRQLKDFLESRAVKNYITHLHYAKHKSVKKIACKLEKKYLTHLIPNNCCLNGKVKSGIDNKLSKILGYKNYNDYSKYVLEPKGELFCRNCGIKLAVNEKFCSVCGEKTLENFRAEVFV